MGQRKDPKISQVEGDESAESWEMSRNFLWLTPASLFQAQRISRQRPERVKHDLGTQIKRV